MVLRKKSDQLSFLHVYHHGLLLWSWLFVMRSGGCVDTFFGSGCNAAIHVAMYSYYALAALGVACPWKRHLTVAQLVQFVLVAGQSVAVLLQPGTHCPASLPSAQARTGKEKGSQGGCGGGKPPFLRFFHALTHLTHRRSCS